jgi:hypothetical protein
LTMRIALGLSGALLFIAATSVADAMPPTID